jgi:hypothetical protein
MKLVTRWLILMFILPLLPASSMADDPSTRCGVERWAVKTGQDDDVGKVDLAHKKKVTVNDLRQLHKGKGFAESTLKKFSKTRINADELVTYELEANLVAYKLEVSNTGDSDFHLVIQDDSCPGSKKNCTVVAEIAAPHCVFITPNSSEAKKFVFDHVKKSREEFEKFVAKDKPNNVDITKKFRDLNRKVKIVGVGFYDFDHGQRGRAPNIFEIHPILSISIE